MKLTFEKSPPGHFPNPLVKPLLTVRNDEKFVGLIVQNHLVPPKESDARGEVRKSNFSIVPQSGIKALDDELESLSPAITVMRLKLDIYPILKKHLDLKE